MKHLLQISLFTLAFLGRAQEPLEFIDLMKWKLELPSGYKATDWKLSNFQKDRFAKPFFYLDSLGGALVMEAYPVEGKSTAKYTRNTLREQVPGESRDANWTLKEGGVLEVEMQVTKMSKDDNKYHKTVLLQIEGRTSEKETKQLGLQKPTSIPYLKILWEEERLKIQRKKLKEINTVGDQLFSKDAWETDDSRYSNRKVAFDKFKVRISAKKGRIEIQIDDESPITYRDTSVKQWYFENFFVVGNYLQSKEKNAHSVVKIYNLKVTHE